MRGLRQSVEESFGHVLDERQGEVLVLLLAEIQQPLTNGCRHVGWKSLAHARASRYGFITRATRCSVAYFQMSSILKSLRRRKARSASSATSRPVLLRYLKQSTTVRAGVVSRTVTPSMRRDSTPCVRAGFANRTMRTGGYLNLGRAALRSTASQTLLGFWLPSPWTRRAVRRQTTPCGTRTATSASE